MFNNVSKIFLSLGSVFVGHTLDLTRLQQYGVIYKWTQYRRFYVASENWCGHYIVHVRSKDPIIEYVTHYNYYATYEDLMSHVPDADTFTKCINDIAIGVGCSVDNLMDDLRRLQSCSFEPVKKGQDIIYIRDKDICMHRLLEYELFGHHKLDDEHNIT